MRPVPQPSRLAVAVEIGALVGTALAFLVVILIATFWHAIRWT